MSEAPDSFAQLAGLGALMDQVVAQLKPIARQLAEYRTMLINEGLGEYTADRLVLRWAISFGLDGAGTNSSE